MVAAASDPYEVLRPPNLFLLLGIIFNATAAIYTFSGKAWVRFSGWVYRNEKPRAFWGEVVAYYFLGVCFIGLFLFAS